MAPFKLKFRMGSSSRSTSLETAPRLTSNSATSSSTTIDSQFNSLGSLNNDQRNLLPEVASTDERIGYSNNAIMQHFAETDENAPPTYEQILNEDRLANSGINSHLNQFIEYARSPSIAACDSDADLDEDEDEEQPPSRPPESDEHSNQADGSNSMLDDGSDVQEVDEGGSCGSDGSHNSDNECDSHNQHIMSNTIINNKSSKKIYKEVAKQWGITCQMSDQCRCMDCQGQYFYCEYQENENLNGGDGGLGAGAPVFIGEVMRGLACTIL